MRKRNIRVCVRLTDDEYNDAVCRQEKTGYSMEAYMRSILQGMIPREKQDERFFQVMKKLIDIANNVILLAHQVNEFDSEIAWELHVAVQEWNKLIVDVRKAVLLPEKI